MMTINKKNSINLSFDGIIFDGNTQDILLEQLEQQGISVPYACRSGICEQCKLILIEGDVLRLNPTQRSHHTNVILACSCIPKSSLKLKRQE